MASYGAGAGSFMEGLMGGMNARQQFRANRQRETHNDQVNKLGAYGVEAADDFRQIENPDAAGVLGAGYADANAPWSGQLQDPFVMRMWDKFRGRGKKKKQKALDLGGDEFGGSSNPGVMAEPEGAQAYGYGDDYADGGKVSEEERIRRRAAANRARTSERGGSSTENVKGADRTAPKRTAIPKEAGQVARKGLLRRAANSKLGRAAGALATAGAVANATDDDYDERANQRFPYLSSTSEEAAAGGAKEVAKFGARRALMFASDLGNNLTGGYAGRGYRDNQQALPQEDAPRSDAAPQEEPLGVEPMADYQGDGGGSASISMSQSGGAAPQQRRALPQQGAPEMVDFSDLDIDAKDVPDMKTDEWKKYRAQMIAAAQKSGDPTAVSKVNDMVTDMQHKGFLNYGAQGFALQQAGNVKGAMAAYRAAFQYFPNGNDVEFGIHVDQKTGRKQIVGFGKDENTGKVVPGTELVMDPERVAALMANFRDPQAFMMWTKDWRDFQQDQRKYEEVDKPLAQGQLDYMASNSESNALRAESAGLRAQMGGAGASAGAAGMRYASTAAGEALEELAMDKPEDARYLKSVIDKVIQRAPPNSLPGPIIDAVMKAYADGTLAQATPNMILRSASSGTPRQALPIEQPDLNDPTLEGLSPEERDWATRPAQ